MKENLGFVISEAIGGITHSRFSGFIATTTVAISLILIGIFLIITVNLGRLVEHLRSRVEIEVFLSDALDDAAIQNLVVKLNDVDGIEDVAFISKEMAISEFERLFEGNGVNYLEVVGENPLPASFRIKLTKDYRTATGAERVVKSILRFDNVGPDDVVFRQEYLVFLEKYIKTAVAMDFIVGTIVCLSALLLVSNSIRLIIATKIKTIQTMQLVGATNMFIKLPFYIQGIFQGLVGGIIASFFLFIVLQVLDVEIPGLIVIMSDLYLLLMILGVLLGMAGSFIAVRKHL